MSPNFVNEDYSTAKAREIARQCASKYGRLVEVRCESGPKRITLMYSDGTELRGECDKGYFMQFGYMGTGPQCFWAFLDESGFHVTYDAIIDLRPPVTLGP